MAKVGLVLILIVCIARAFWRVVDGVLAGLSGDGGGTRAPGGGSVQMVRDPVCGTFLVPDKAVILADRSQRLFFCSTRCRDAYRAGRSTGADRPEPSARPGSPGSPAEGRTP